MARVFHHIANYSPPYNAMHTVRETPIECTRINLSRCLMTVGNPSFFSWASIRQFGFLRALYDSIISKHALVMQNLHIQNHTICRHPIFDGYVSDQKRIVSYNLGMAFTKFYSEAIFRIPNLVHIEFLKKQNVVTLASSATHKRSREPDLVGNDSAGQWHLFEAKGVSGAESQLAGKIADAKAQLSQVVSIHSAPPQTRSACASYFGLDRVVSRIEDPEGDDERSIEIRREAYFDAYYTPFLSAESTEADSLGLEVGDRRIDGIDVVGFELERGQIKLLIGLEAELQSRIGVRDFQLEPSLRQKLHLLSQRTDERYSVGLDGYVVQDLG